MKQSGNLDKWMSKNSVNEEEHYVMLPCSKYNISKRNDKPIQKWYLISNMLSEPITSITELIDVLKEFNYTCKQLSDFKNLENVISPDFITTTLPFMQKLALRLPELCSKPIPYLKTGMDDEITLSREQIACLLCHAFFCTFPHRSSAFPSINFHGLFRKGSRASVVEKLKCICNYFDMISKEMPTGNVTFKRQVVEEFPIWKNSTTKLCPLELVDEGSIEDSAPEYSQVDFANSFIGGGVIGNGCVQEEIRFIISPDCIISRLFMEELDKNEAIIIKGSKRYSDFLGYSDTFEYHGPFDDKTPVDNKNRIDCEIIAIDAIDFSRLNPESQFKQSKIDRELNKAYAGFYCDDLNGAKKIATGLWGCGAFLGNKELKSVIQLMAASEAQRSGILFYSYGNPLFKKDLKQFYALLSILEVTVGELYEWILTKPIEKGLIAHIRDVIIRTSQELE